MRTTLLALALACFPWTGQEPDAASVLLAADRAFCQASRARGLEGWLEWFAPDAFVATPAGELRSGADELPAHYRSIGVPPTGFRWEPEAAGLAGSGDLGWSRGAWEIRAPGTPAEPGALRAAGTDLTIWERQPDGVYRVLTDAGGRTDVRTRLEQVAGPPLEWSTTTERSGTATSGELAYALGSWTARCAETPGGGEARREGTLLSVWKRTPAGAWAIETELGFDH